MDAYIYNDEGASPFCVNQATKTFRAQGCKIHSITSSDIHRLELLSKNCILVMPGGRDLPYLEKLGVSGCRVIQEFVSRGGVYMGFCAGAYFAAKRVLFEPNTPIEVRGERPLSFYPGLAYGTLYPQTKFNYGSETGAWASRLAGSTGEIFYAYYNGGCAFKHCRANGFEEICVYDDVPELPSAVLFAKHGEGRVLLSGVHLEISPEGALENGTPSNIVETLMSTDHKRIQFLSHIFKMVQQ